MIKRSLICLKAYVHCILWKRDLVWSWDQRFSTRTISCTRTLCGRCHLTDELNKLGKPLRVVELGESGIDEETFMEYIQQMRTVYTADKYHLLGRFSNSSHPSHLIMITDFNCNSFTNDCAGFLTAGSIPSYIKGVYPCAISHIAHFNAVVQTYLRISLILLLARHCDQP